MKLLIVIVNFRIGPLVVDCLRSLQHEISDTENVRVVVTDNASGDGSIEHIQEFINDGRLTSWISTLPLPANGGFASGNNAAIRPALQSIDGPDYILLLNPDTVVQPGAITALIDFMDRNPKVGIAGSRLEHPDGRPQRSAFRFPSIWSEFENGVRLGIVSRVLARHVVAPPVRDEPHETDWVAGASMIIRREVFDAIGLLDEGYFMYFEELDFCKRARTAGWSCWYVPQSRVVHLVGQASGVTNVQTAPLKRRPPYWFASRRRYFLTHQGRLKTFLADVAWIAGYGAYSLRRLIAFRPRNDPPRLGWDFVRFNFLSRARKTR